MNRTTRVALVAIAVIAATIAAVSLDAFAAPAPATASVPAAQRVVLAGTTGAPLDVTVTSAGLPMAAATIDTVVITTPSQFTITSATLTGWTAEQTSAQRVILHGALVGGQSATFHLLTDVGRPIADRSGDLGVTTSSNGGRNLDSSDPASAGAVSTSVRVLQVLSAAVASPLHAADGTVTQDQATIVTSVVRNAGAAALAVTPTLAVASGGSPATIGTSSPASVPAGGTASFSFPVTFGAPGSTSLLADAAATGADALAATSSSVTVQSKAAATYVAQSLQPSAVVPGNPYGFTFNVNKTGDVAVALDQATGRMSFGPGFSAPLTAATTLAGGNTTAAISFSSTVVPSSLADGSYTPTITLTGVDANDAPVTFSVTPDAVTLDRLAPAVTPTLTVPASKVAGADAAATNGSTLTFGGTLTDNGSACGLCSVTGAVIRELSASGATIADRVVTVTNTTGNLSGSSALSYNAATTAIRLVVTVRDRSGNATTNLTATVPVDLTAPSIETARTGRGTTGYDPDGATSLVVTFNEPIAVPNGQLTATDWVVAGHSVTGVALSGRTVTLTLSGPLGLDETPTVSYQPTMLTRAFDRVNLQAANQSVSALDGLFPAPAQLDAVNGSGEQFGGWFSGTSTPTFLVSQLVAGHGVEVLEQKATGVVPLVTGTSSGTTTNLTLANLGSTERSLHVVLATSDGAGNRTVSAVANPLTLDFTTPTLTGAAVQGRIVTVSVSELISWGRSYAIDWEANGIDAAGEARTWQVTGVQLGPSNDTFILTVNDGSFNPDTDHITSARYVYAGDAVYRYADRAGNRIADQSASVG